MKTYLEVAVISDVGNVRQNNEDNYFVQGKIRQNLMLNHAEERYYGAAEKSLFAVADGMGGESKGEIASLVTVQSLHSCENAETRECAMECIQEANEMICDEIMRTGGKRMGSTLAALYVDDGQAVCCNVGDSRIYLMREGKLSQLSVDHTSVQMMVNMGVLTKEEARVHKKRHVLSQNIGIFPDELIIEPAFTENIQIKSGDLFLLCTDGLTDMIEDSEIHKVLLEGNIYQQANRLIQCALQNGGRDNVTVVLINVV